MAARSSLSALCQKRKRGALCPHSLHMHQFATKPRPYQAVIAVTRVVGLMSRNEPARVGHGAWGMADGVGLVAPPSCSWRPRPPAGWRSPLDATGR